MSLSLVDICKTYDDQTVVDHINFSVNKGEIVGFLGPNGAGKTTTMKILSCYVPPSSGVAKVCGFDVNDHPLEVRKKIGYLPEHNPLYLNMYVKEILAFVEELHRLPRKKDRIKDIIEITGLHIEQNKKIGQLSKGYRQRVGLALALIHEPEVLILDEPTTGLDPNQLEDIRNLIRSLGKEKTLIFSSHIMQEVQAVSDRVIIINKGKIVADKSTSDLSILGKGTQYHIEFSKDLSGENINDLKKLGSIRTNKSNRSFIISGKENKDIRAEIFNFAVSNNLILIGLRKESEQLEDLFKNLTAN